MSGAQDRLQQINSHVSDSSREKLFAKRPDDVVITLALRSALTNARNGAFKDTSLEDILIAVLEGVRTKSGLPASAVEEIVVGNVLHPSPAFLARGAALAAGFPATTATSTVSRWCSSGLLAAQSVANQIRAGCIAVGVAVGAESMSQHRDGGAPPFGPKIAEHPVARDIVMPMGWTAENLARDYAIERAVQDGYAAESFTKAERAQREGWAAEEILPIKAVVVDKATGKKKEVLADRDDGVRYGTTVEKLSKIRPAFPKWPPSTTTGGNASQITDGVAALVMMRRDVAERLGQPVLAKFVASTVAALEPRIMGAGPTLAVPKLLKIVGIGMEDVDLWEINEAFGSVIAHCVQKLGIDRSKVNPRGGAIAFGHPLGCTGARQIVTAIAEMRRTGKRVAVTTMCVGTGMGMAGLIVSEA